MNNSRWRPALLFGVPLALLTFGLFAAGVAFSSRLDPLQAVLIGLLLYIVIPAMAGYVACAQHHDVRQRSAWVGFRVGLVSWAVFMLAATLLLAVMFMRYVAIASTFNPRKPHQGGLYDPAWELGILATNLGMLALLHGVGVLLSMIGGRIGGLVAERRTSARIQGEPGG